MIANKKEFTGGLTLMIVFWVVFAVLLSPIFPGKDKKVNLLSYMDNMYNSISKFSAYYIPEIQKKAEAYKGNTIEVHIKNDATLPVERLTNLMQQAGMTVKAGEEEAIVSGDMGGLISAILADADLMYANNGEALGSKYGSNGKQVLSDWNTVLKSLEKRMTKQEKFPESKMFHEVRTKSVEPSYNYYGIQSQSIREKAVVVIVSLVGYVIYTVWFGFAILFMFEGWGLKLEH